MSAIEFGKFGAIPFEEFSEQVATRAATWDTVPVEIQHKQYSYIRKYLANTDIQNVPDEQWKTFSERVHCLVELHSAHAETARDNKARQIYHLNRISKRELHLGEHLGCTPLLLRGPEGKEVVISTKTFDATCGEDARDYRLGLSTFSDRGTLDLTDCSLPAFAAIVAFLSGKDITATLTTESVENVFAKAHLWKAHSLQKAVVKECERLLNNLLAQSDKNPAQHFVETVLAPIKLLDSDTHTMTLPLFHQYGRHLLGTPNPSNFAKHVECSLCCGSRETMIEICSVIATTVNNEPPANRGKKLFSMLRELVAAQEKHPNKTLRFPSCFLDDTMIAIVGMIKGEVVRPFRPVTGDARFKFAVDYTFGAGHSPGQADVPSHMRNELMVIMELEGIRSLIKEISLEPLNDAPSTREELEAFLRGELVAASNATVRPREFDIILQSHDLPAPNIVEHYTKLAKSLTTTYAPLCVSVRTY